MQALIMQDVGKLEVIEMPEPIAADGEVVMDVVAAGICGSDFHSARDGGLLRSPPIVMGHEFAGIFEGRRVAVDPMITCNQCSYCTTSVDNFCRKRTIIGIQRQGGFAQRVAVPVDALVDLPNEISFEAGALIEPLAVALHAFRLATLEPDCRIGVLGAGTIGLMVTFLCVKMSVGIDVVDIDLKRCASAKAIGARSTGTRLEGEFDIIFDCAGSEGTHLASVEHLKPGGTAVWIGNESPNAAFDAQKAVRMQSHVIGSAAYTHKDFRDAAKQIENNMTDWVTQTPLAEGARVMYALMKPDSRNNPIKVILKP